jgi:apolipoprotein N-acyltransferase
MMRRKHLLKPVAAILLVIACLIVTSLIPSRQGGRRMTIAAIQGPDSYTLREETAKLRGRASTAVWSECGLMPDDEDVRASARENKIHIAANFCERQPKGDEINVSYYISPYGKVLGKCRKQHLFGREAFVYSKARAKSHPVTDETGFKVGVPTCYDTMFTDVIRGYVRDGARLILVPNCDPEAPNQLFGKMHAGMTAFRAAENAVPIAMADVLSVSTIFDSNGRVVAQSTPGEPMSITGSVTPGTRRTLYNRIGDLFAYLCIGFVVTALIYIQRRSAKSPLSQFPPTMQ